MTSAALLSAEDTRTATVASTTVDMREDYSQYLTPYQTALLATSMMSDNVGTDRFKCLDLGAGTGILSVALAERYDNNVFVDGVEMDSRLASIFDAELNRLGIAHKTIVTDALSVPIESDYDRVILNPPYKKMAADDPRQAPLPVRSPNLYSAFLMLAIKALKPGGQCVAIVPRSWMNGQYFQAFREWMFDRVSIDALHIYGSRTEVFSDTDVLQETMLLAISKNRQKAEVRVTESQDKIGEKTVNSYPFSCLVDEAGDKTVRVRPVESAVLGKLKTLKEEGLCASTGKVVDFRSRNVLSFDFKEGLRRLIYSCNFSDDGFKHPVKEGKAQWIDCSAEKQRKQLIGPGSFVVVKRFSSKEERRRVKAYPLNLPEAEALENHLNYIHAGTPRKTVPMTELEANGLSLWLRSTQIEEWFRSRSGSTQVNASDLNAMPTPPRSSLSILGGQWYQGISQEEVDAQCRSLMV